MNGNPHIPLNLKSAIAIIDTISLGTSLSASYFYILYKGERSESLPWDASSRLMKEKIEKMKGVIGNVCVSRSRSVKFYDTEGFRWAVRFDSIWDDLELEFNTEHAIVFRGHKPIDLNVSIMALEDILDDWDHVDGDETMCTFRHAEFIGGSGTNLLGFRYLVLSGDSSSNAELILNLPPSVGLKAGIDSISTALNGGIASEIYADLVWSGNFGSKLVIDSRSPRIVDVIISSSSDLDQPLHAGDSLFFQLVFDKPIVVSLKHMRFYNVSSMHTLIPRLHLHVVISRYWVRNKFHPI